MGRHVGLDIEANGLLDQATKLHCLVVRDLDTDALLASAVGSDPASVAFALSVLDSAELIYSHNLIRYDRPALDKLTGYKIPWSKVRDTLTIAGLRWTNLKELDHDLVRKGRLPPQFIGKNHLEAWGYRLGIKKGDFAGSKLKKATDEEKAAKFATWSPEMQTYCEEDTKVLCALVRHIRKAGATPALAIETEQELAEYLDLQEQFGWPFDLDKAIKLQAKLAARREEIASSLTAVFKPWFKPGKLLVPKRDNKKLGYVAGCPAQKVELVAFNPGSRQHIASRLQKLYGWKPTKFTAGGQPEVNEDTIKSLPQDLPGVKLIAEYLLVVKRLGQLAEGDHAWLKYATKDMPRGGKHTGMHHIHGACLQSGTITHRGAHLWPNIGQVPKCGNPYGEECRELFCVPEGWVQVGADASGLELRELSHYMARFDGGAYGRTVVEGKNEDGTDVHSVNRNALGLEGKKGRDTAKTFVYAFLYGSGDLNLGQMLGVTPEEIADFKLDEKKFKRNRARLADRKLATDDYTVSCMMKGALLRSRFLKNLPALNALISEVKAKAKLLGYLLLHDGRRVPVRYIHAALNCLLQGGGAVVCKRWVVRMFRRFRAEFGEPGWLGLWAPLGWIHDEVQIAARPHIAERMKEIAVEEIRSVGLEFNLRLPLDGEAKQGRNWMETH